MSILSHEQLTPVHVVPNSSPTAKLRVPILWFVLCLLPALGVLYLILHYGVDTPWWDQWIDAYVLVSAAQHHLTFAGLIAQHNQSRGLFPRLWMLFITRFGHWNQFAEMGASLAVACLTTVLLLKLALDTCGRLGSTLIAALFGSALIFSWVQYEAWLWGITLELFISPCCLYGAWVISRRNWRSSVRLTLCAALAFIAQFSFSSGIFLWLVLSPVVFLGKSGRGKIRDWIGGCVFWIAAAAASCGLYFHNYVSLDPTPTLLSLWQNRGVEIEYVLAILGGPVGSQTGSVPQSATFGAMLLLAFAVACAVLVLPRGRAARLQRAIPWLMIALFALICAAAASVFRFRMGLSEALAPRYAVTEAHFAIGTIFLLLLASRQLQVSRTGRVMPTAAAAPLALAAGAGVLGFLLISANLSVPPSAASYHRMYLHSMTALQFSQILPDPDTETEYLWAKGVHDFRFPALMDHYGYLRPHLLNEDKFAMLIKKSRRIAPGSSPMDGYLDAAQREPNGDINLSGWSWNRRADAEPGAVILTYRGADQREHPLCMADEYDLDRPDIAAMLNRPEATLSGWARHLHAVSPVEKGQFAVTAWAYDPIHCQLFELPHILTVPAMPPGQ